MSRIYAVSDKKSGKVVRYVRAKTLNGAVRAAAAELYDAKATTTDDIYLAAKAGSFTVLDAVEEPESES